MEARKEEPWLIKQRYELITSIGTGGMATVYRGWDYMTSRYIAIKAMRPPEMLASDPRSVERFRREAEAAARINHPNVVSIYDFVEEQGRQYLIMEFVDGINLKRQITYAKRLSVERALSIAEQVCAALSAAHARGIIHRDIKPQNILLTPDGRARLTDFGIVRVADTDALTHEGIVLGTADYLSPEQAQGDPITPASDIYSLGIVLYEMLVGTPPFTGANPISVAMRHATEDVPALREVDPSLPAEVEGIVRQAVARDLHKRYRSAAMMASVLHSCRMKMLPPEERVLRDSAMMVAATPTTRPSLLARLRQLIRTLGRQQGRKT